MGNPEGGRRALNPRASELQLVTLEQLGEKLIEAVKKLSPAQKAAMRQRLYDHLGLTPQKLKPFRPPQNTTRSPSKAAKDAP